MAVRRVIALLLTFALAATVFPPERASAFMAEYFANDTSGQSVYEDMAVKPQAIHRDGVTYIAYQGWLNDPYIVGYDHDSEDWDGPYKVGDNPLNSGGNPLNTHGAPALHIDQAGYLHVFWGAHGTPLRYSRTVDPLQIDRWQTTQTAVSNSEKNGHSGGVTYPQLVSYETTQGIPAIEVFYRTQDIFQDGNTETGPGWASRVVTGTVDATRITTTPSQPALQGRPIGDDSHGIGWYASFLAEKSGRVHMVALAQPLTGSVRPFERDGVFHAVREPGETRWRDVTGGLIGTAEDPVPSFDNMVDTRAQVYRHATDNQNQVSIAVDSKGMPAILFLSGTPEAVGKDSHDWMFGTWDNDDQKWDVDSIAKTDHFFDAAVLDYPDASRPDYIEAFLVVGGTEGKGTLDPLRRYEDRGGDIWRYVSRDAGKNWDTPHPVREADLARGEIYNDPQIVRTDDPASNEKARLLFCQWDNEGDNFINKVFLWGDEREFAQKEFAPVMHRLSGASRVETAVRVSEESFPLGPPMVPLIPISDRSRKVFIATGENYADALSGVPLAYAYSAPMLFVVGKTLPPAVAAELTRLRGAASALPLDVVVLGGPAAVAPEIVTALRAHSATRSVRRVDGNDRYEVSRRIALELARVTGWPDGAFVASGENFPDALAAAPVAAAKGYPILLTRGEKLSSASRSVLTDYGMSSAVVIGGPDTITPEVFDEIGVAIKGTPRRVSGSDRYATAAAVAEMGLTGVDDDLGVLAMDRFVVASGENFPDALSGGLLAARVRGPVVLTQSALLSSPAQEFLNEHAYEVLDAYVVGGPAAIDPAVFHGVGSIVEQRKDEQRFAW